MSRRLGSYAVLQLRMTHAYSSRTLFILHYKCELGFMSFRDRQWQHNFNI